MSVRIPESRYYIDLEDLIVTVNRAGELLHAEAWTPSLDEWVTVTDLLAPKISKYQTRIMDEIERQIEGEIENDAVERYSNELYENRA